MLSIGGLDPTLDNTSINNTKTTEMMNATDPFILGIKVFDMTALTWTNVYNPGAAPYTLPAPIADIYANGIQGPSEWNSEALKQIFFSSNNSTSNTTNPAPTTAAESPGSAPANKKSNIGAIAGGVVGGVAGLLIIAGLAFWLLKRRKRTRDNAEQQRPPMEELPPSYPTEMFVEPGKPRHELGHESEPKAENRWELNATDGNNAAQPQHRYEIQG